MIASTRIVLRASVAPLVEPFEAFGRYFRYTATGASTGVFVASEADLDIQESRIVRDGVTFHLWADLHEAQDALTPVLLGTFSGRRRSLEDAPVAYLGLPVVNDTPKGTAVVLDQTFADLDTWDGVVETYPNLTTALVALAYRFLDVDRAGVTSTPGPAATTARKGARHG
jgi:hypothetical protein